MAINKKLIHFKKEASFKPELDSGNILQTSIVFIQDTKKIWTHGQYYNYDDSTILEKINSLTKNDVGLNNVDNTSDTNKPVSTAQAAAIKVVQDDLTSHKNNETNPHKVTKSQVGLGNVDNTSDLNKPISTATQEVLTHLDQNLAQETSNRQAEDSEIKTSITTEISERKAADAKTLSDAKSYTDETVLGETTARTDADTALDEKKLNKSDVIQDPGQSTEKVMSQKAVTDALNTTSERTQHETINALCDNVYIDASTPNTNTLFTEENKRYNVSIPFTLKADSVYRVGKGSVIHFYMDGKFTGSGTLQLDNTQIEAPKKRIFDDTVNIAGLMRCDAVYPEWFGAVGDGVTDDAVAIQKAIYNAGHMPVVLTAEKYLVKSTITLAEPFPNSNINPYFEYAHAKGGVWNDKQTLIVEHDIIGDISLDGPVIRTGSNHNYIKINGTLVVRCPKDTAIGIDTAGTKTSGDTTSMTDIRSGDFGYSSEIEVRSIIKGKDGFSYQNSADETYATTYGLGKGTAIVFCSGAGGSCTVREINGFGVGIHMPFTNGTKVSVNTCGCINDFLINGGARFLSTGVTRNDIRLGTHYLSKKWSWTSGRTDICIIRVNDDNHSEGQPVEVANNTFTIDSNNTSSAYIYNYIFYKCGTNNFRGNKLITSCTLMNTGMSPWIPVKIALTTNGSGQNNANLFVHKVGWDYKTLDITKGYNTVVENVIIDSQEHTSTYRYGDQITDVKNRFLCEKIIITTKNAPEYPSNLSEDSIKVIVPHYSQMSKVHFVSTKPTLATAVKGHIYVLDAVADTGGFEKHEVWGIESGTLKQLGYYSYNYLTQGKDYQTIPSNGKDGQVLMSSNGKGVWADLDVLDLLSYGVEWKPNVADPVPTRVGNMNYHKTLPIQSNMKGCIFNPVTKKVVYWLDESDWNYKKERYTAKKLSVAEDDDTGNMLVTLQLTAEIVKSFENSNTIKVIHPEISQSYEHRIVSRTENTITYDDDTIDGGVNSSYTILVAARLDGYDGEVFVYVPEFYIKSWDEPERRCVRISPTKIDDSWEHQPATFVGAYMDTVLNTVPENMGYLSTLEVSTAISVANSNTYCRGGQGLGDSFEDIFKTELGKCKTTVTRNNFRNYTRKAGKEIMSYRQYKNIMYWLYVIEYANFNSQEKYIPKLTDEGFHQGGLGDGITNVEDWSTFSQQTPICPNGYTNNLGNGTGTKQIGSRELEPVGNIFATRWRGIENPFGDVSQIVDGVIINADINNHPNGMIYVYTTDDPTKYGETFDNIADMVLSGYEVPSAGYIKEWDLGSTAEIIPRLVGGNASTYKCDYHLFGTKGATPRILVVGGHADIGSYSGLGTFFSSGNYKSSFPYLGFRSVCVIP